MAKKWLIIVSILVLLLTVFSLGLHEYLSFEALKANQINLETQFNNNPVQMIFAYIAIYIGVTAFSIPGAAVLTLAGGAMFGFWLGLVAVSFASTIGATLAFLLSRYFLRDTIQEKFGARLTSFNEGIRKDGAFYLFTLRLVPVVPFFLINLGMGLTSISTYQFFFVSQIGMLLGTAVYVNAGTQLAQIESLSGIVSMPMLLSFMAVGLMPLIAKKTLDFIKAYRVLRAYPKPQSFDYNLVVIGAGAAGLVSSYIAAAVKAKVALIEKHKMGGDCLNTGCVPSKALIKSAKVLSMVKKAQKLGMKSIDVRFEFADVMARIRRVIQSIEPHDSIERYEGLGVECIEGEATIVSPYEVKVGDRILSTRSIIIATGARPFVPDIPGLDQIAFYTSDTLWNIEHCPKRFLILGGGPIGVELAQAFARLGASVCIVEMADRILGREDAEVSALVEHALKEDGVKILTRHKATHFKSVGTEKRLQCEYQGENVDIVFDDVLIALGRRSNVTGFGAEDLGIQLSPSGRLASDTFMRTNFPNIFVAGDATGEYQFTHVAAHEAWYATVNALFSPWRMFAADYRVIPMVTFTDPEVARVGINELDANARGIKYEVSTYGIDDLDRAIADEEAVGMVKVLTVPGKDIILGATIVGARAGDLIAEFVLAMKYNIGLNKILGTIHAYPTYAEANKYAAGVWKRAHAPKKILELVQKYHTWRRGASFKETP
jgi:pyruvate/2-oxoglutarate dehydrogenase complex dihydrolipoamide dehydrogenase (E3) component/uncharacterized membrane protein YdjX (TVP38/TMEM64 family)